jgi:ParB/RepB/Spo0J family partition protein
MEAVAEKVEFKAVPLKDLEEAPYNPRRTFDEESLKDLVESIRTKGVLNPILARPVNGHLEIVGGARRFRAARAAGLKEIPCQIRDLTDDEALEVAVIDNLQRADVAPAEEARGFQELLRRGYKAEDLAKKVSKSIRYIYGRIELLKLAAPVLKALEDERITPSHAQLIATLDDEDDQKKVLDKAFVEVYADQVPDSDSDVISPTFQIKDEGEVRTLVSIRDFKQIVSAQKLGSELIEQLNALKIAGHKAALISGMDWNQSKQIVSRRRWKAQGAKPCKFPAKGVLVDGKDRGKVLSICLTTSCKKHFATSPVGPTVTPEERQRQQEAAERKAKQEQARHELARKVKVEVFRQVCNKVRELPKKALNALLADRLWDINQSEFIDGFNPAILRASRQGRLKIVESLKPIEFAQTAIAALCWDDIEGRDWYKPTHRIADFATDLKVDLKAIEKGVRGKFEAELQEKRAAEQKEKKPARKAGKQ